MDSTFPIKITHGVCYHGISNQNVTTIEFSRGYSIDKHRYWFFLYIIATLGVCGALLFNYSNKFLDFDQNYMKNHYWNFQSIHYEHPVICQGSWGRIGKGEYIHWTYKVLFNFFPGLSFWLYLLSLHPINYVSRQILWCNFKQARLLYYSMLMIQDKSVLPKDKKNAMNPLSPKPIQTKAISKEWVWILSFTQISKVLVYTKFVLWSTK